MNVSVWIDIFGSLSAKYDSSGNTSWLRNSKYHWITSKINLKVEECSLDRAIGSPANFKCRFEEDSMRQTFRRSDIVNQGHLVVEIQNLSSVRGLRGGEIWEKDESLRLYGARIRPCGGALGFILYTTGEVEEPRFFHDFQVLFSHC